MREQMRSLGPTVRVETAELARIVDIDGRGRRGVVRFEHPLIWIREVSPAVVFRHGGLVLKDGTCFCDVGRYMRSLEDAVEAARDACDSYSVEQTSSLEVAVLVTVTEIPVLAPEGDGPARADLRAREHAKVPEDWLRDCDRVEACLRARNGDGPWPDQGLPRILPMKVAVEEIWSSQRDGTTNAMSMDRFRRAWTPA